MTNPAAAISAAVGAVSGIGVGIDSFDMRQYSSSVGIPRTSSSPGSRPAVAPVALRRTGRESLAATTISELGQHPCRQLVDDAVHSIYESPRPDRAPIIASLHQGSPTTPGTIVLLTDLANDLG